MDFQSYIQPELLILVPVLYLIGMAIKKATIKDKYIPFILGAISIALCAIWVLATVKPLDVPIAIFTAITQGVLIAGASVYANQIIKQIQKED